MDCWGRAAAKTYEGGWGVHHLCTPHIYTTHTHIYTPTPTQSLLKQEHSSELTATKELLSIAQRARTLLAEQNQIDAEVSERYDGVMICDGVMMWCVMM